MGYGYVVWVQWKENPSPGAPDHNTPHPVWDILSGESGCDQTVFGDIESAQDVVENVLPAQYSGQYIETRIVRVRIPQ